MRSFLGFAIVAIGAMFQSVTPAAASWSCIGPDFVCGSPASEKSSKPGKKASAAKASETAFFSEFFDAPVNSNSKKSKKNAAAKSYSSGGYSLSGKASYYWQPQALASGGRFNPNALTAAHKTLPFGTKVRVTNKNNGKSVVVTINDRGPYVASRIIDLSRAAAYAISMQGSGVVPVQVAVLGKG